MRVNMQPSMTITVSASGGRMRIVSTVARYARQQEADFYLTSADLT